MLDFFGISKGRPFHVCSALHYGAMFGDVEVVQLLVKHGADLFLPGNDGDLAMHKAAAIDKVSPSRKGRSAISNCLSHCMRAQMTTKLKALHAEIHVV